MKEYTYILQCEVKVIAENIVQAEKAVKRRDPVSRGGLRHVRGFGSRSRLTSVPSKHLGKNNNQGIWTKIKVSEGTLFRLNKDGTMTELKDRMPKSKIV